jgi:hypothetical protein
MVTINRADFAVTWRTSYPSVLSPTPGRLVTRQGHRAAFEGSGVDLGRPWESEMDPDHWSSFWSYYLGGPDRGCKKARRGLGADAAWEYIVPFRLRQTATITGPAGSVAEAQVLVYPSAITVTIRVTATDMWPLDTLASALATIRSVKQWSLVTGGSTSSHRSLDGIATDLRDDAARWLTDGNVPQPGPQTVLSVAAPIAGEGDGAALNLDSATASSCLAGLAVLGPPGPLNPSRLLDANTDTRLGGRFYVVGSGHAIWHPAYLLDETQQYKLACLLRNHADLVAHIAALAGIVSWAGDQVAQQIPIPVATQPLVRKAIERLEQLSQGDKEKTYRSGLAKKRIEPTLEIGLAIRKAL